MEMMRDHMLAYVFSGEMVVDDNGTISEVHKGECIFLRKDNHLKMTKQPLGDEQFQAVFLIFKRNFLRDLFQTLDKKMLPTKTERVVQGAIKLPPSPDIESLFYSLTPYFNANQVPSKELMNLKLLEGVYSLLNIDQAFYPSLFDFTEPWKIDILEFMDNNYMFDLSMEDIAAFTGRSLATFKRDFRKISNLSPQRWITEKRLKVAYEKIKNQKHRVSDVYLEVGFKNLSHFSSAFKRQFGFAPTVEC
jgi:AraC-type DNA-binding domain-containing proteins